MWAVREVLLLILLSVLPLSIGLGGPASTSVLHLGVRSCQVNSGLAFLSKGVLKLRGGGKEDHSEDVQSASEVEAEENEKSEQAESSLDDSLEIIRAETQRVLDGGGVEATEGELKAFYGDQFQVVDFNEMDESSNLNRDQKQDEERHSEDSDRIELASDIAAVQADATLILDDRGESNDVARAFNNGGVIFVGDGDHFCEDDRAQIEVTRELHCRQAPKQVPAQETEGYSQQIRSNVRDGRVWATLQLQRGSKGSLSHIACCWETKTGFAPTVMVASGPWSWNRCDILNGGGPAIECRDEADMIIRRSNIGGYGTGPRPSASIGILAWGTTAGASCKLMKCQIQNTVSHAAKFEALSTGELQNCKIKHCGRTFAVHPKATLLVQ